METPNETYAIRRKRLDHERYMRQRESRLEKQREYYRTHTEQVRKKIKECKLNRWKRNLEGMESNKATP